MSLLQPDISDIRERFNPSGVSPELGVALSVLGVLATFYLMQSARIRRVEIAHHLIGKR